MLAVSSWAIRWSRHGARTMPPCLREYFAEPRHNNNVGKSTIEMMVLDTTALSALLSRGTSDSLD